ncbi:MAG: hypothetical protein QME96_05235 [Myxococcota bacterium]|nr:hypothetical protein [Myxococcota bacterium]
MERHLCCFLASAAALVSSCGPAARHPIAGGPAVVAPSHPPRGTGRADPLRQPEIETAEWAVSGNGEGTASVWIVDRERRRDGPVRAEIGLAFRSSTGAPGDGVGWTVAAYRAPVQGRRGGPAELLWESLESVDAVAVADIEGDGALDVAAARWADDCPDPVDPAGAGPPCLLVTVWKGVSGIPQTYRMEAEAGRPRGTGREDLDRLAGLLAGAPCPVLDLRDQSVLRVEGLLTPGGAGELVEGIRCGPHPSRPAAAAVPAVALSDVPGDGTIPAATFHLLAAEAGWADGYELLDDLDGDGVRDWLWIHRTAEGDEMTVTAGPGRGRVAAAFRTDGAGNLIHRLVAVPPGGRARLESWAFERAGAADPPRVLLRVAVEPSAGERSGFEIVLPLLVR